MSGKTGSTVSGKDVFPTLLANCSQWLGNQSAFSGDYFIKCYENHAQDSRITECKEVSPTNADGDIRLSDSAYTLNTNGNASGRNAPIIYGIPGNIIGREPKNGGNGIGYCENVSPTLTVMDRHAILSKLCRRLTPLECERLMGFPDYWTKMPWKGKTSDKCPDAPRYKACGNSWAVNCARWVLIRLETVDKRISVE